MKSFLPAILLSLSITFSEISGKELKCYQRYLGESSEDKVTCVGDDAVCITGVDIDDKTKVVFKNCAKKVDADAGCQELSNLECKYCDSDLCNNMGSTRELICYQRYLGESSEDKVTCVGDDAVCITGVDIDDKTKVVFKNCAKKVDADAGCQELSNLECKYCNSDLCNDQN